MAENRNGRMLMAAITSVSATECRESLAVGPMLRRRIPASRITSSSRSLSSWPVRR